MKKILVSLSVSLLLSSPALAGDKVGVFFGSYGDVDNTGELKGLVTSTLTDPDVLPLPKWLSSVIANIGWQIEKKGLKEEYEAIGGGSNMRQTSQKQADAVVRLLQKKGYDAKAYTGFTMTFPSVGETMAKIQADGVNELVVFYQGAQYSKVTAYIVFREVAAYLEKHPEWDVKVTGIKSFSKDSRFVDLMVDNIAQRLESTFADFSEEQMCLFFPMHGNVMRLINSGDPYLDEAFYAIDKIREAFPAADITYGFQNHDEIPFIKWTTPDTDTALTTIAQKDCEALLINGRISFTVDSLETLYDHAIDEPNYVKSEIARLGRPDKKVFVEPMFNSDPEFVKLLSELAEEAMNGAGDLTVLR